MAPLWAAPKIRNMAEYIVNMHVDGHHFFNFADSAAVVEPCSMREYLFGKAVGSKTLAAFAARDRKTCEKPHLPDEWNLWYRLQELLTDVVAPDAPAPPVDAPYPGIGLFIAHDGRYAVAVKGGNNGESHNHNDVGSITLYKDGKPFLIDVGVETYTARTFSPRRYEIWTMQSGYHNLPTFGDVMQSDGENFAARDVKAEFSPARATISLDIAAAYPAEAELRSYWRTVTLHRGENVEIVDVHDGDRPAVLSLMTCVEPVIDGTSVRFDGLGAIDIAGGGLIAVDRIDIDDARLAISWPGRLYRLRIAMAEPTLKLRIV
jgi:hypothetical protein